MAALFSAPGLIMALAATGELEGWKTGASALSRPWLPLENEDRVADDVS